MIDFILIPFRIISGNKKLKRGLQTVNYMVLESSDNEWYTVDYNRFAMRFGRTSLNLRRIDNTGRIGFEISFENSGVTSRYMASTKRANVKYVPGAGGSKTQTCAKLRN